MKNKHTWCVSFLKIQLSNLLQETISQNKLNWEHLFRTRETCFLWLKRIYKIISHTLYTSEVMHFYQLFVAKNQPLSNSIQCFCIEVLDVVARMDLVSTTWVRITLWCRHLGCKTSLYMSNNINEIEKEHFQQFLNHLGNSGKNCTCFFHWWVRSMYLPGTENSQVKSLYFEID